MIEIEFFPAVGGMTLFTILAIAAMVHIIQLVANITFHRCLKIMFVDVASAAIRFLVCPDQGKVCFIMVVVDLAPMIFIVAAIALIKDFAHARCLVRTFLLVAVGTCMRCLPVFLARFMAAIAAGLGVLSA